jgi:hypothetical protein
MIKLAYQRLIETPLATSPFQHALVPHFVPEAELISVVDGLPRFTKGGSFPVNSLRLGDKARALMEALEGTEFRSAIEAKFGLNLQAAPTMATLRGISREKDGRIHCDSTAKLVTVLLYLNPRSASWARQEGCLRLLRSADSLEDYEVEVPPVDGTLLIFPNGPKAWHGHRRYVGQRYVVQLNYMTNDDAARSELRRHRLSAVVKRLIAA